LKQAWKGYSLPRNRAYLKPNFQGILELGKGHLVMVKSIAGGMLTVNGLIGCGDDKTASRRENAVAFFEKKFRGL
jgi:hypothetical protein